MVFNPARSSACGCPAALNYWSCNSVLLKLASPGCLLTLTRQPTASQSALPTQTPLACSVTRPFCHIYTHRHIKSGLPRHYCDLIRLHSSAVMAFCQNTRPMSSTPLALQENPRASRSTKVQFATFCAVKTVSSALAKRIGFIRDFRSLSTCPSRRSGSVIWSAPRSGLPRKN